MKQSLLIEEYKNRKEGIKRRLEDFKNLSEADYYNEFLFCLLTPQSNAKKCWQAVQELKKEKKLRKNKTAEILKKHTRFHNNKAGYVMAAKNTWKEVKEELSKEDRKELRNWIQDRVKGYGLKEASHFLRNIGKSDNQIAILDRHILRNLKSLGVIKEDKIKNRKDYLEIEGKFISFSNKINIPIDELDLLFWSQETGEIFK